MQQKLRDLEIGMHFLDSENAQHNVEIAQRNVEIAQIIDCAEHSLHRKQKACDALMPINILLS